eukprot:172600_1
MHMHPTKQAYFVDWVGLKTFEDSMWIVNALFFSCVVITNCINALYMTNDYSKYAKVCNITTYDKKCRGDGGRGGQSCTQAIKAAIKDCSYASTNTTDMSLVLLPTYYSNHAPTIYMSAAVWLESNIEFRLEKEVTLLGIPCLNESQNNISYPWVYTRMGGIMSPQHSGLLNGGFCESINYNSSAVGDQCKKWKKLENVVISGQGTSTINGNGESGWFDIPGTNNRPMLLDLIFIKNLQIYNVTMTNSPHVTLHTLFCTNIFVDNININTFGENTAGFYPDSCTNALLQNSVISTGDDCVCVKSGKGEDGLAVGVSSNNITIRNVLFLNGHGLTIGSEGIANISNVLFDNITCDGTGSGPKVKGGVMRAGTYTNITYSNIILKNVGQGLTINDYYGPQTNETGPPWPIIHDIYFVNISGSAIKEAGNFSCFPQAPCYQINLKHIDVVCGNHGFDCNNVYGESKDVTPKSCINSSKVFVT